MIWFDFFVLWHINIRGLFNAEAILFGTTSFLKGITPKVDTIKRLDFEFTHYDIVFHHVSHYATGTRLRIRKQNALRTKNYEPKSLERLKKKAEKINENFNVKKNSVLKIVQENKPTQQLSIIFECCINLKSKLKSKIIPKFFRFAF